MSADILQFIPRGRTENQERAFWKGPLDGPDREAILRAGAVEIESVRVVTPADNAPAELNPDGESA